MIGEEHDTAIADEVRKARDALNTAIRKAQAKGLGVEVRVVQVPVATLDSARDELVSVAVKITKNI